MANELPQLEYAYNALEPYIDAQTMEIHHSKHHQAYVNNLNNAIKGTEFESWSAQELLTNLDKLPETIRTAVKNNGGGHWNHTFFWQILQKETVFQGEVAKAIEQTFGSFEAFKEEFTKAGMTRFGSGWAWLVLNKENKLQIISTPNQDSPISDDLKPLLCVDVWEHAYYLKYQNKRNEYLENFFFIINWEKVESLYKQAMKA